MAKPRPTSFSSPLMHVFRSAHEERAARMITGGRDVDGERVAESSRSARRGLTERALRHEVSINLGYLMNTIRLEAAVDLADFPHVQKSILNFGIPDLASIAMESMRMESVADDIREAIRCYEPRLIASSLKVHRDNTIDAATLQIRFHVSGDLACDPVAVPVQFVADVDLHTAKVQVARL